MDSFHIVMICFAVIMFFPLVFLLIIGMWELLKLTFSFEGVQRCLSKLLILFKLKKG